MRVSGRTRSGQWSRSWPRTLVEQLPGEVAVGAHLCRQAFTGTTVEEGTPHGGMGRLGVPRPQPADDAGLYVA